MKFPRVYTSTAASQFDRVSQMQHLVEQDVFDGVTRHTWTVEDATDDDGVVRRVVVAEAATGVVLAPGKLRTPHQPVEKAAVEIVKNFFQVIVMSPGGSNVLASAHLADEACFGGNVLACDIAAIAGALDTIDGLAIELGEEDVGDRKEHRIGCAFEQIGNPDVKLALTEADGVVDGDEWIKTKVHGRRGCPRAQFAIRFMKDFGELWGHVVGRLADRQLASQGIVLVRYFCFFFFLTYSSTSTMVLR